MFESRPDRKSAKSLLQMKWAFLFYDFPVWTNPAYLLGFSMIAMIGRPRKRITELRKKANNDVEKVPLKVPPEFPP